MLTTPRYRSRRQLDKSFLPRWLGRTRRVVSFAQAPVAGQPSRGRLGRSTEGFEGWLVLFHPTGHLGEDAGSLVSSVPCVVGSSAMEAGSNFVDHRGRGEQAVGLAHQPGLAGLFRDFHPGLTHIGAAPDRVSEVDEPPSWRDVFVPVDDADGLIAEEDDVVGPQVVVGDDFLALGQCCPRRRIMEATDQLARTDDLRVGEPDRRANPHVAFEVAEYLPALTVDTEIPRSSSEANPLKMLKQPMNVVGASVLRSTHGHPKAHDSSGLCAPTQLLLGDFRWFRIAFHVKRTLTVTVTARSNRSSGSGSGLRVGLIGIVAGHGLNNAIQIVERGKLDGDLALAASQLYLDPSLQGVGQSIGQVTQARSGGLGPSLPTRAILLTVADGDDLLDRPDRQTFGNNAVGQTFLGGRVVQRQQRPGVTSAQHTCGDPLLHGGREVQQTQRVGDVRAGPADLTGELLVGGAEVVQQLLVRSGLLQGVKLLPVQVLHQRVAQQVGVGGLPHDRRNVLEIGSLAGPPATLTHDELVVTGHDLADNNRLEQPDLADGGGQLVQRVLIEGRPRLTRVRRDRSGGSLGEVGADDWLSVGGLIAGAPRLAWGVRRPRVSCAGCRRLGLARAGRGLDERAEALAEPTPLLSHRVSLIHHQITPPTILPGDFGAGTNEREACGKPRGRGGRPDWDLFVALAAAT